MVNNSLTTTPLMSSDSDSGDGVFTPISGAMSTGPWTSMRMRWSFANNGENPTCEGRPGIQYSNDGVTWDDPVELIEDMDWKTNQYPSFVSLGNVTLPPEHYPVVHDRLLCRLGFFVRRTTSSGGTVPLMPSVLWEAQPTGVQVQTVMLPADTIATAQSTGTVFLPITDAITIANWTEVRTTAEVLALTDDCEIGIGYWLSDDGVNWGSYDSGDWVDGLVNVIPGTAFVSTLGMKYSSNGDPDHPSGWVAPPATTKAFVQLGFVARDTGTPYRVNFGRLTAMVEIR